MQHNRREGVDGVPKGLVLEVDFVGFGQHFVYLHKAISVAIPRRERERKREEMYSDHVLQQLYGLHHRLEGLRGHEFVPFLRRDDGVELGEKRRPHGRIAFARLLAVSPVSLCSVGMH